MSVPFSIPQMIAGVPGTLPNFSVAIRFLSDSYPFYQAGPEITANQAQMESTSEQGIIPA